MSVRRIIQTIFLLVLLPVTSAWADDLGNIEFPNSGSEAAQEAFLTGVKALHSFQFDEARFAFEDAQEIDPSFALAYWGQAMSDNHPLWAQQDGEAATAALNRLAPTFEGRLAKAGTEKEKAFLTAVETLYYSADDKLERDMAYSEHMAGMHEQWPDDDEISILYSLSLLGLVRPGDRGFRRQAKAAAIASEVFQENPNHPGAAHFVIHAFDDPDHAILALPAARVYAGIAPAAAHALHMPSHIFLQLGMWEGVVNSNIDAYAAARAINEKYNLPEGREDFHTLSWLAYANLMLGHHERGAENIAQARATVDRNPGVDYVYDGYLNMRGRQIIESGDWQALELVSMDTAEGRNANWVAVVGMSAARLGDAAGAQAAEARLAALSDAAESEFAGHMAKLLEHEVAALRLLEAGDMDGAIERAKEAADMEVRYMRVPSGPPMPLKPAGELYADVLLATGNAKDAMQAFQRSLDWIPQRTPSLIGFAQAAELAGEEEAARETYKRLRDMPGANPKGPAAKAVMESVAVVQ